MEEKSYWYKQNAFYGKGGFFSFKDFSLPCKELRESEVKNTLELPIKVVTVALKFKKAFP